MLAVGSHAVERLRGGRLDAVDVLDVAPAPVMVDVHPPLAVAFLRRGEIGIEHALQRSAYAGLDVQRTEGPIVIQIDLHGLDRRHAEPLGDRPWRHREIDLGTQRDRIDHIGLDTQLRGGIHRRSYSRVTSISRFRSPSGFWARAGRKASATAAHRIALFVFISLISVECHYFSASIFCRASSTMPSVRSA